MSSTKEQERKALEKIKKIVEELGEDSYIAAAFEGCFEIAEDNICNDFACSMKQRVDSLEQENKGLNELCQIYKSERDTIAEESGKEIERLNTIIEVEKTKNKAATDVMNHNQDGWREAQAEADSQKERAERAEKEIIALKAKLYDLMTKEA